MPNPMLAAAGLASAWMLLWGAAAAIPIILHFLYRRKQIALPWAAMQLLLQVIEKEARRVRIEKWLLLLLRTLILLVLALVLARPFWNRSDASAATSGGVPATTWILAIDVSYSMNYRADSETRLQAAQQRAREIVESAGTGDAFALVELGQPARASISPPTYDSQSVLDELQRLTINDAGCDVRGGLQIISDLATHAQQNESLPSWVRIVILSDLGREHWQPFSEGSDAQRLRQLTEEFPVELESLAEAETANLAITAIRPISNRPLKGQPVDVDVTVANFSAAAVEQLPVQLSLDGQSVDSEYVNILPNQSNVVRMSATPTAQGWSVLTATLPGDRLATDNVRGCTIEVRDGYQVLIVEQQTGDARVIKLSLQAGIADSVSSQLSTVSALELPAVDLGRWQVILLNDLETIDRGSFQRLGQFVEQGGGLIGMWGPRTKAAAWNALQDENGWLGFRFLQASPVQDWTIDPMQYQSPVVAPFAGFPDAGLVTTPIFRYWEVEPVQASRNRGSPQQPFDVDLATTAGDPLIVRQRRGAGNVASLLSAPQAGSSAAGETWNAMATWPSFVPLMQTLVQVVLDAGAQETTVLAGQPLIGKQSGIRGNAAIERRAEQLVTIVKPNGAQSQVVSEDTASDGLAAWVFTQTQLSGLYTVRNADGQEYPYFVNANPIESRLQSLPRSQLPQSEDIPANLDSDIVSAPATETEPRITRTLLVGLGILLLLESLLAWGMGRRAG